MKKQKCFYTAEEIKKMVLQENKLPHTTGKNVEVDCTVKSREPIDGHKHIKIELK